MTATDTKALQAKEKREVAVPEQTKPGLIFTPAVDIFETDKAITLLADLPGVKSNDLSIDLNDNVLTISGGTDVPDQTGEAVIFSEYDTGKYFRQFTLSEVIDQAKIDAKLTDGVLRLTLPKVEKVSPRKIAVKAA